jgi:hypothetical protein
VAREPLRPGYGKPVVVESYEVARTLNAAAAFAAGRMGRVRRSDANKIKIADALRMVRDDPTIYYD